MKSFFLGFILLCSLNMFGQSKGILTGDTLEFTISVSKIDSDSNSLVLSIKNLGKDSLCFDSNFLHTYLDSLSPNFLNVAGIYLTHKPIDCRFPIDYKGVYKFIEPYSSKSFIISFDKPIDLNQVDISIEMYKKIDGGYGMYGHIVDYDSTRSLFNFIHTN